MDLSGSPGILSTSIASLSTFKADISTMVQIDKSFQ
jgi:hypothetical protein